MSGPEHDLPEHLRPLFWDVDPSTVDAERHASYVIERAIEFGDDRAISWMLRRYPDTLIGRIVRSSRCISRNTANLWSLVLGIPREEIRCFSRPSFPVPGISSGR
jgi:hypothetical protein